jgi:homoaconitase
MSNRLRLIIHAFICRVSVQYFVLTSFQKQGILPLWFADKASYASISAHDKVTTMGLADLLAGKEGAEITLKVTKPSGEKILVQTKHTMSKDQVEWLRAGSALNWIGELARREAAA